MATVAQYHCTINATGDHAIATLHDAQRVHVRLDDGQTAELSLHDVCLAGPAEDDAFRQAVRTVAQRAVQALPENAERIADAVTLVLNGAVELTAPGYATVASQSQAGLRYSVNGTCECPDFPRAPAAFCKHRLAVCILKRALEQHEADLDAAASCRPLDFSPSTVALVAQEALALPEAPASVNTRLLIGGREVQLTLRDTDEARLLTRLHAVLAQYPGTEPAPRERPAQEAEGWCAVHGVQMRQQSNKRGSWWSHRLSDGSYCKGR